MRADAILYDGRHIKGQHGVDSRGRPAEERHNVQHHSRGKHTINIRVNGTGHSLTVDARRLLVQVLREDLRLTGTHIGCDTSQCGACTVDVDGDAVKSCTVLAVMADGAEITTIEGLAAGNELHPIQAAFREHHALQCGYCTPGMIMSIRQLLQRNGKPSTQDIRHHLAGNICRCTGYHNIVRAVEALAAEQADAHD
jgi:carbon-monoxide dehydrogenase small subunit